jgi:hypothetical protein
VLAGVIPIVPGKSGIIHRISTEIRFRNTYPVDEPSAYDIEKRFKALPGRPLADRHLGEDGWCCLWLSPRSEWDSGNPDTLLHFLRQLVAFFERQLVYDAIKRWPGREYAHGDDGYVEYIRERLCDSEQMVALYEAILRGSPRPRRREPCPCGSGKPFASCHKSVFADLSRCVPWRVIGGIRNGAMTLQTSEV